jgi:Icc protein
MIVVIGEDYMMDDASLKIIQLSDIHIFGETEKKLLGVNTFESFKATLELMKSDLQEVDFIILSGDLSQDYSRKAYIHIADLLKEFKIPIYCVPGNHDSPQLMNEIYPREKLAYYFIRFAFEGSSTRIFSA